VIHQVKPGGLAWRMPTGDEGPLMTEVALVRRGGPSCQTGVLPGLVQRRV